MKRAIVCALLALTAACGLLPTDGGRVVETDQEFILDEGAHAVVLEPRMSVEFSGVPEDTRCPREALCTTAGNATVRLRVTQRGFEPAVLDLRTDNPGGYVVYNYHAFELLDLDPERSIQEPDPDYRVRLRVFPVFTISN